MTTAYPHQLDLVKRFPKMGGRVLVVHDPGLGKTFSSLLTSKEHLLKPMLVVCPSSVKWQWQDEAAKHLGWRCDVLESTKPKKSSFRYKPNVVVLNWDILYAWAPLIKKMKFKCVVFDEGHNLANLSARKTKAAIDICLTPKKRIRIPNVLILTATPIMNKTMDLFTPLHICKPDVWKNPFSFGHRFCGPTKNEYGSWEFNGSSNIKELNKRLKTVMHRVKKVDVLKDLPPKIRTVLSWDLPDRRQYEKEIRTYLGWLKGKLPSELSERQRGEARGNLFHIKHLVAQKKLPLMLTWLQEWLETNDGKIIVFATHKDIIDKLHQQHERISVLIDGSVVGKKRRLAQEAFQKMKRIRVMFGNLKAAGTGLNLDAAHTVAKMELGWNCAIHEQAEDRPYGRLGNIHGVQIFYLIARNTIEVPICKMIQTKGRTIDAIIDGKRQKRALDIFDLLTTSLRKDFE